MYPSRRTSGSPTIPPSDSSREKKGKQSRIRDVRGSPKYPESTRITSEKSSINRDKEEHFSLEKLSISKRDPSKEKLSRNDSPRESTSRNELFKAKPYKDDALGKMPSTSKEKLSKERFTPYTTSRIPSRNLTALFLQRVEGELTECLDVPDYNGWKHAVWARNLANEIKKDISASAIQLYISNLYLCIPSIKHWKTEIIIHFYTMLEKVGFFSQTDKLAPSCRLKIYHLHDSLVKQISSSSPTRRISIDPDKMGGIIGLFRAISKMMSNRILIEDKNLIRKLLIKTTEITYSYKKFLTPFQYKELSFHCNIIYSKKENREILNKLIEKIILDMPNIENSKFDNEFFCRALLNLTKILSNDFPCNEMIKYCLFNLINKTKFDVSIEYITHGLYIIAKNVKNNVLDFNDNVTIELNNYINHINKNKCDINANDSIEILRSITILAAKLHYLPNDHLKIADFCLENMVANRTNIEINKIFNLFLIMHNFYKINMTSQLSDFFDIIKDILLNHNNKNELFSLKNEALHSFYCNFSSILRYPHMKNSNEYLPSLIPLFKALTEKYSKYIISANFAEKINGFSALSHIIARGFLPNAGTRKLIRDLFSSLDEEQNISTMTHAQKATFLRAIASLGTLMDLDLKKYADLFFVKANQSIKDKESINKKLSLLWSILAFTASHRSKLEKHFTKETHTLNNAMLTIFRSIDKASLEDSLGARTMHLVASWLGIEMEVTQPLSTSSSIAQANILLKLQRYFPDLVFVSEHSFSSLPPCDIAIPKKNIFIEVQGPQHYLDTKRRYLTGKSAIKLGLYKKAGIEVIEIHTGDPEFEAKSIQQAVKKIRDTIHKPKFR